MRTEQNINELEALKQREIMERLKIKLADKAKELGQLKKYKKKIRIC